VGLAVFEKFDFKQVSVKVEVAGVVEEVGALVCLCFFLLISAVEGFTLVEDLAFSVSLSFDCQKLQLPSKSVQ
jgi:hypothetical protein